MRKTTGSVKPNGKLFPTDLPSSQWVHFEAEGFEKPVCGVIYRFAQPATNGLPLGAIDTGCLDLETSGLWGYCTIFNSHVPRRGPLNLPFLGLSVGGGTWVLANNQTKPYETRGCPTDSPHYHPPLDPVRLELHLEGVHLAEEIHYWGHYPVADLEYETSAPVSVGLRAWTPFLPGDIPNSLIPGIVFEVHLRNPGDDTQNGTIAFSFPGPTEAEAGAKQFVRQAALNPDPMGTTTGSFNGVTVTAEKSSYALGVIGEEQLRLGGELGGDASAWAHIAQALPTEQETEPGASAAVDFELRPGDTKIVRFVLAWYSPEWKASGHPAVTEGNTFTHMYAVHYASAVTAAEHLAREHESLLQRVLAWQEVLYTDDKIPGWLADSLINVLCTIPENGMWAVANPPIPDWVRPEDGLFGMNECPRVCSQIECIGCSFYGNMPLIYMQNITSSHVP